jgi:RNA polymerase sigma factor (sigma-70 family)
MRATPPALPAAVQLALVAAWQTRHDFAARDRLVLASEGLVWSVAARFAHAGAEWDDLVAEARLALLRACDTYPADRGRDFGVWAYGVVRDAVLTLVRAAQRAGHDDLETVAPVWLALEAVQEGAVAAQEATVRVQAAAQRAARLSPYYDALQRWLAEAPMPLGTLGAQLGMSRARLSQIETALLDRLAGELAPLSATP